MDETFKVLCMSLEAEKRKHTQKLKLINEHQHRHATGEQLIFVQHFSHLHPIRGVQVNIPKGYIVPKSFYSESFLFLFFFFCFNPEGSLFRRFLSRRRFVIPKIFGIMTFRN